MVLVKLKWNKLTFDNLEVNPSDDVPALKKKVFDLTGVPATRQKLMAKNAWPGTLKDDADLKSMVLTNNQQVLLMGTADTIATPTQAVTFVEDMTAEQKATKGVTIPAGLVNMGNTCYMNATVQCLRHMKDLRETLQPIQNNGSNSSVTLSNAFKTMLNQLDASATGIPPTVFVQLLRAHFPQFAQTTREGHYMQQDAEEFFNILSMELGSGVRTFNGNFDSLLTLQMEEQLTCSEAENEPVVIKSDKVTKLVCNIQGSVGAAASAQINHLHDGVKLGLEGTLEKMSTVLNRNALWKKKQRISSLPKFIGIHFMRFFWKATPESRDHTGLKCKILRAVSFPDVLDVYDFCTEALQQKLKENRQAADKVFTSSLETKPSATETDTTAAATTATAAVTESMDVDNQFEGVDEEEKEALMAALRMSMTDEDGTTTAVPAPVSTPAKPLFGTAFANDPNGLPAGFTGLYSLHSIVTHKGRSADSGHYIGWVRQADNPNFWWKYDDDEVSEVDTDEIMRLKGGGDKDMTYMVFYRYKLPNEN